MTAIIISLLTCSGIISSVLFFPKIRIKKIEIQTYWIVASIGAVLMIVFKCIDIKNIIDGITSNHSMNPLKILCLFISMTILSIFLDEVGFFKHMANIALRKSDNKQISLFIYLYIITSILTIFTSNDIIILTFTPFICYFSKNAKINPLPYLFGEFVAANTWSMMFIIGNPTNIYIATTFNIGFFEYLQMMFLPTIFSGVISFIILFLVFYKQLKKPMTENVYEEIHENKFLLIVGLIHLSLCTILLAISSYINLEMWYITLGFAVSLLLIISIYKFVRHEYDREVLQTLKRAPWVLIPFLISMFVIVLSLKENTITLKLSNLLGENNLIYKYGLSSFLCCNLINNIPMSVLFTEIIANMKSIQLNAIFATIIGSNIGAILTPIGALAGIMWISLLKNHQVKFHFYDFLKYGIIIGIPTILFALVGLSIMI